MFWPKKHEKTEFLNAQAIIQYVTYSTINTIPFATRWRPLDPNDRVNKELQCNLPFYDWPSYQQSVKAHGPTCSFFHFLRPFTQICRMLDPVTSLNDFKKFRSDKGNTVYSQIRNLKTYLLMFLHFPFYHPKLIVLSGCKVCKVHTMVKGHRLLIQYHSHQSLTKPALFNICKTYPTLLHAHHPVKDILVTRFI